VVKLKKGFTLIELLVVIAIIAVLAAVVFVALDPARRFADARNSSRTNDVNSLLTAIHESIVDNEGVLPSPLSAGMAETQLGTAALGCALTPGGNACGTPPACGDLTSSLGGIYLASIPRDPSIDSSPGDRLGYSVAINTSGIVTVRACNTENFPVGEFIQVSR